MREHEQPSPGPGGGLSGGDLLAREVAAPDAVPAAWSEPIVSAQSGLSPAPERDSASSGAHGAATQCRLSVVIPTRNERDNVAPLLERLHAAMNGDAVEVIFVDDSSDDTPHVIAGLSDDYATSSTRVHLIHRPPEERGDGLAGAVVSGFRRATSEYVAVMDSDLQHPPEVLVDLLSAVRTSDAELVVGSRYVGDGHADGLSSGLRRFTSLGAGSVAHALFPRRLKSISDPMSGLFLVRRDVLDPDSFHPIGFKILLEIAVRRGPMKVAEVPYVFAARHAGESKAGLEEGLRFLRHLARLRLSGSWGRMLAIGAIGLTGIVVNTLALWVLISGLGTGLTVGALLATQFSTGWNSLLSLALVYRGRRGRAWWSSMLRIAAVNNAALLVRIPLLHLLVHTLGLGYLWANVLTLLFAFGLRFLIIDRTLTRSEMS